MLVTGSAASYFSAALNFAHLARCAAAILLLPAAEIVRLGFGARSFAFAHRAICPMLIRLLDPCTLRVPETLTPCSSSNLTIVPSCMVSVTPVGTNMVDVTT